MTNIDIKKTIPDQLAGLRLDAALAKLCPEFSRAQWQSWLRDSKVTVDGIIEQRINIKTQAGQLIHLDAQLSPRDTWQAQDLPLNIFYEDSDLIIINKPAGVITHPGAGNPDQTLVNALLHYDSSLSTLPRAGLVHRLDKDTTGLLVIARNLAAHHHLVKALQARQISREYQAIVHGIVIAGGSIHASIGRHPQQRTKMSVVANGKDALTHYRVIKRFAEHSLLQIALDTGRTHQIRVHLAHIHYPIVGDPLYGKSNLKFKKNTFNFSRQALHAWRLSLPHPTKGVIMSWEADLPQDMQELLLIIKNNGS